MPDLSVRCPGCEARLRVPDGKSAVRCQKCGTVARVPEPDDDPDERPAPRRARRGEDEDRRTSPARRQDLDEEDDRPRSRRRRDEDEDEEEDERPRRRRRVEEDADEDDRPRPRRRKATSRTPSEGPWLLAVAAAGGCFLLSLLLALAMFRTTGLPPGQDGPGSKLMGLGIGLVASLIIMPLGIVGVKNRRAIGKFGIEIEGTMGVVTGFVQACMGGLIGGFVLYGLVFTLINGR